MVVSVVCFFSSVDRNAYEARFLGHDRILENRAKRRTSNQKNGSNSTCDSSGSGSGSGSSSSSKKAPTISATATAATTVSATGSATRRKRQSGSSTSASDAQINHDATSSTSPVRRKKTSGNRHSSPAGSAATAVASPESHNATSMDSNTSDSTEVSSGRVNPDNTDKKTKSKSDSDSTSSSSSSSSSKFPKNPNPATSASTTSVALPSQEVDATTVVAARKTSTKIGREGGARGNGGTVAVAAREKLLTSRSAGNSVAFQDDSVHSRSSKSGATSSYRNSPQKSTSIGDLHGAKNGGLSSGGQSGSAHALARGWHLVGVGSSGGGGHGNISSSSSRRRRKSRARPHAAADGTLYAAATHSSIFTLQRQDATVLSRHNTPGVTRQNSRKGGTPTAKYGKKMWDNDGEEKHFMESMGSNVSGGFGAHSTSKPSSRSKAPAGLSSDSNNNSNDFKSSNGDPSDSGKSGDGAGATVQTPASKEMEKVLYELVSITI